MTSRAHALGHVAGALAFGAFASATLAQSPPPVNTLNDLWAALQRCWVPPPIDQSRPGMQITVLMSFKRSGEIIATPRVTYATPGIPPETRETYLHAIMAALERCTPLHFSAGLGGAVAGRPIAIRFVDNRDLP